ncbi:hypothetical protein [Streptomyces sp. NPDC001020]
MRKKMLRSVLVAAFSAVVAVGVWSGFSGAKGDTQANTSWPIVVTGTNGTDNTSWPILPADGAGS